MSSDASRVSLSSSPGSSGSRTPRQDGLREPSLPVVAHPPGLQLSEPCPFHSLHCRFAKSDTTGRKEMETFFKKIIVLNPTVP